MGSVVGLVTWDHDKAQASLREEQAAVEGQSGRVHALARRLIEEHEEYRAGLGDGGRDGAVAEDDDDSAATLRRRAAAEEEEQELMNKLDFGLGEASVDVRDPPAAGVDVCDRNTWIFLCSGPW